MTDIISIMPKMLTGEELDKALEVLPEYHNSIREKSVPERLAALQDIYKIYVPSNITREIYIKMYLSLLRSLQKKQSILAVRQYIENSKMIRQKSYESIIGGSDSFTIIGESGIGKSSAVSRVINVFSDSPVIEINNAKVIPCLQVQAPADSSIKGLLLEILRKADKVLETKYHENAIRSHATTDMLIGTVSQVEFIDGIALNEAIKKSSQADATYFLSWTYFGNGERATQEDFYEIVENTQNPDAKKEQQVLYGIATKRTELRALPTDVALLDIPSDPDTDNQYLVGVRVN